MTLWSTLRKYLLCGLFLLIAFWGKSAHFYVDSSATSGANNGTSWANAYLNLQTAINVVPAGDTLWVANGHYYPGPPGDNIAWFDIKIGQVILGGFSGLNGIQETSASQRNFFTNLTILSGDLDKNGVHSAPDAYHVVNSAGKDTTAVVDGVIIEMGNAVGTGGHSLGGGIFSFGGGGSYYNCVIQNNYANDYGGGVHAIGNFKFLRCVFRNNQTATVGGAMTQSNAGVRIRVHNCVFVGNTSGAHGGAVYAEANDFQMFNCTFLGNQAGSTASCLITTSPTLQVRNCIMWGNPGPDIAGPVPIVDRCLIEGGYGPGTDIIDVNPEFSDALGRIRACSPAVDAGDTLASIAVDYDGNPRPFDGDGNSVAKWDLGAFEAQVPRSFPAANPIIGPNPACANSFNNLYRVTTDNTPLSTYQWTLTSGGTISGTSTNDSVRVNWGPTLGSYNLQVVETNVATGCSTPNSVSISLQAPPTVSLNPAPNDSICIGDSVLVTATGTGVSRQWYYNGAVIPGATSSTIFASQAGYYNQVITGANGCADSAAVSLKLYLRPLPVVTFTTNVPPPICQGDLITITGSAGATHQWYRNGSIIGGATTNQHTTGVAGLYNMLQTDIHGCTDSAANAFSLVVNPLPVVTVIPSSIDTICIGDSLAISGSAAGAVTRQWFRNGVAIPSSNVNPYQANSTGIYNVRITDTNNCTDSAATGHRLIVDDFVDPVAVCQNVTVHLNGSGTATLIPAMLDGGSTDNCAIDFFALSSSTMTCAQLGTNAITLTPTDFAGRTDVCTSQVTVIDSMRPTAVCNNATIYIAANGQVTLNPSVVGGGSSDNCAITSQMVSPSLFVCADTGSTVVTYTATDASGNFRTCMATVTIEDSTRPAANCSTAVIYLDGLGNASITAATVNNASTDNCGIASTSVSRTNFTCADVPGVFVTLSLTDISGNVGTCQAFVRVIDSVAPVAACRDTIIYIDSTGVANLTTANLDDGSSDNCAIDSTWISQTSFTCADTGLNVVTLSIIDADTNLATCLSNVTILDTVPPQAVCTDTTFYINASGIATVDPAVFGILSVDNCNFFDTSYVDIGTYNCSQTGVHVVELFVVDVNGRVDSCTGNVTILDSLPPDALCQNIAPILNMSGNVTITAAQVNNGTTDNCTLSSMVLDRTSFTCADVGPNTVILTATDVFGNSSTCSAVVTVTDTVQPIANCQNFTTYLNGAGTTSITTANVNNGSSDNCGIDTLTLSQSNFTCANTGANNVILTVTDTYGNSRTCNATVTVIDSILPVAVCQNITAYLNVLGQFTLSPMMVDGGSTDNCSISNRTVSQSAFTCANIGANSVTLTVTDPSGLQRMCTASVNVLDTLDPVPACVNGTFYLNASGNFTLTVADVASGSTDNCAINSSSVSQSAFDCGDLGSNSVTVNFSDASGNTSSCAVTVTIEDSTLPVANCQNVTLILSGAGTASLAVGQVDAGSTDACGVDTVTINNSSFSCNDVGANTVVLSVTDSSGNVGTCNATVTVQDTIKPQIVCGTATVNLDSSGNYILLGALLSTGSTDVCGIDTAYATPFVFDCQNIGVNTVLVTVEDPSGNTDTCTTTFSLQDAMAPVAICDSITLQLGSNGIVTLAPNQLGPSSYDNCGLDSAVVSQDSFTCADIGYTSVLLSLWDSTGNTSNCTGVVNIVDTTGASAAGVNLGSDTTSCNGDTLIFSGPAGMASYLWSTGDTTQSISVSTAGTYWVEVVSPVGCEGTDTVVVSSFVINDPNLRSESGELVVCTNDTLQLLVDPGFVSYQWSTGSTGTSTSITTGGNYSVIVTDANGCSLLRTVTVQFAPFPAPNPVITPGGNVGMCENTSIVLDVGLGYYAYLWNTNQSTPSITAFIPGTYSVQVWNGFGCHSISDPVTVFTLPSPYPNIQQTGNTLYTTTPALGYQWYIGGIPILGATNSSYVATITGSYTVRAYYVNGCEEVSNPLSFVVGLPDELVALQGIEVFPNPSNGVVYLRPSVPLRKAVEIRVMDMFGRVVFEEGLRGLKEDVMLDLTKVAAGVYVLEIRTSGGSAVHRLVIE